MEQTIVILIPPAGGEFHSEENPMRDHRIGENARSYDGENRFDEPLSPILRMLVGFLTRLTKVDYTIIAEGD